MFEKNINKGNRSLGFPRADDLIGSIRRGKDINDNSYALYGMKWIAELGVTCKPFNAYLQEHKEVLFSSIGHKIMYYHEFILGLQMDDRCTQRIFQNDDKWYHAFNKR